MSGDPNDDQRSEATCINCGTRGGPMRRIITPNNQQPTVMFVHADIHVCLRRIVRYVAELHMCMVSIAEDAAVALAGLNDLEDEP
jgi:hypothetical protein